MAKINAHGCKKLFEHTVEHKSGPYGIIDYSRYVLRSDGKILLTTKANIQGERWSGFTICGSTSLDLPKVTQAIWENYVERRFG